MKFDWNGCKKPIIALSPMANFTDSPFCSIVKTKANPVIFREMVSANAIVRNSDRTADMARFDERERPIILQLFGSDPEMMGRAAKILEDKFAPDGIDINMGCPMQKITATGAGSALLKNVEVAVEIIKVVKAAVGVPVSIKMRTGWSDSSGCVSMARAFAEAGADMITIHGRTRAQAYSGKADWNIVAEAKKAVKVPVLLNGDVFSAEDARRALQISDADGVMVARGALGNPWIFEQMECLLHKNIDICEPTPEERFKTMLQHAELHLAHYGDGSITTFRAPALHYIKNMCGAKKLRVAISRVSTFQELSDILNPFLRQKNPNQ
jgi:nifR3 family TIM-barrel protein